MTFLVGFCLTLWMIDIARVAQLIDWLALILLYWVVALPARVGFSYAVGAGLILDLLNDAPLGHNAMVFCVIVVCAQLTYLRLRKLDMVSQMAVVFLVIGVAHFVETWLNLAAGYPSNSVSPITTGLLSALMWPAVLSVLRRFRRYHGMTEW